MNVCARNQANLSTYCCSAPLWLGCQTLVCQSRHESSVKVSQVAGKENNLGDMLHSDQACSMLFEFNFLGGKFSVRLVFGNWKDTDGFFSFFAILLVFKFFG